MRVTGVVGVSRLIAVVVWSLCFGFAGMVGTAWSAGDVTTPGCPNEGLPGFRTYLPWCRAYEQASPPFKDGNEAKVKGVSANGSQVMVESLGSFAGAQSNTESHGAEYLLSRSGSGWVAEQISPSAALFPAQQWLGATVDLSKTLWFARSPSESLAASNFYVRETNGRMVEIGPMFPPSVSAGAPAGESENFIDNFFGKYAAASSDLSHILFYLADPTTGCGSGGCDWPGDSTNGGDGALGDSLYEYSGVGNVRPELVGVNNDGRLISTCTTYAGSPFQEDLYNVMSTSGNAVFFTAAPCANNPGEPEVAELYARLDQEETVPVSEPSAGQCGGCETGVRAPAEFNGASEDGSKVFFSTSQELLPDAVGSSLYEYDFDATPGNHVSLVSAVQGVAGESQVQGVARVSEDGSHVYFVAGGRLTTGAREGTDGRCIGELSFSERTEEVVAEEEEGKAEAVTEGGECRPKAGADNLYVYERTARFPAGHVAFIATLCSGFEESGSVGGVKQCTSSSSDQGKVWGSGDQRKVQVTPDGEFMVFESGGRLTEGVLDTAAQTQVFEYDAASEELVRVSKGARGDEPAGQESANTHEAGFETQVYATGGISPVRPLTLLALSNDGERVMFESSGALTEGASAAAEHHVASVYEFASSGGVIDDGDVYLISDGVNALGSKLIGLDGSGGDVFFQSSDQLVPQDTDSQYDLYDARMGGGFPAPDPPAGCEEGCGGALETHVGSASGGVTSSGGGGATTLPGAGGAPSVSSVVAPKAKVLSLAERRAKAFRACKKVRGKGRRRACEARVRVRYRVESKAKKGAARSVGGHA